MMTNTPEVSMSPISALVTGYIGFQNAGDELLLRALVRGIARHHVSIRLETLSRDPASTRRVHGVGGPEHPAFGGGVRPSLSTRWRRTRAVLACDILLLGPGGFLQDYDRRGVRNIFAVWRMAVLARLGGGRVVGVSLGAGPLVTRWGRRIAGSIGRMSDLLLLRDDASTALLGELGVPPDRMRRVADLALAGGWDLPPKPANTPPVLGVSIFNFHDYIHGDTKGAEAARTALATALDAVAARDIRIRFISMQGPFGGHDEREAQAVRDRMRHADRAEIAPYAEDPEATLGAIAQCDWFFGMRLHSLIMALIASVPMAALSYHPKVQSFMDDIGRGGESLALESLAPDALGALLDRLLAQRALPDATLRRREVLADQAEANFVLLAEYLRHRREGRGNHG